MTNGEPNAGVAVGPGRGPEADAAAVAADERDLESEEPAPQPLTSADYSVAFTPRNLAIGLAIVAGVVAFALSRRRRRVDADSVDEAG